MIEENRTREQILQEVLDRQKEIDVLEEEIHCLYEEALKVQDDEDDLDDKKGYGYINSIRSHTMHG